MLIDGIKIIESANIVNAVVDSGPTFPTTPNAGEVFYLNVGQIGFYVFNSPSWERLSTVNGLTSHENDFNVHLTSSQNNLLNNISVSVSEINELDGTTGNVQAQIDSLGTGALSGVENNLASLNATNGIKDSGLTIEDIIAGRTNKVINGNMDFWQRGNSFNTPGYTADRWNFGFSDTFTLKSPSGATHFVMNGEHYLAMAEHFDGSSLNIDSRIFKLNIGNNSWELYQSIPTHSAIEWVYFEINTDKYLFVANERVGTFVFPANSEIFKYNPSTDQFDSIQLIPTNGGVDGEFFEVGGERYLAVNNSKSSFQARKYNSGTDQFDVDTNILSSISGVSLTTVFFEIGTDQYICVGNPSNTLLVKFNSGTNQFDPAQTISFAGHGLEHFVIGSDHYLVVSNNTSSFTILKFNFGTNQFDTLQTVNVSGTLATRVYHLQVGTNHYLTNSCFTGSSELFKYNNGTDQFDLQQTIPDSTTHRVEWTFWEIGGVTYGFGANGGRTDTGFILDSFLYKFNQTTEELETIISNNAIATKELLTPSDDIGGRTKHFIRLSSDNTIGSVGVEQRIENVKQFNDKSVTISFFARAQAASEVFIRMSRVGYPDTETQTQVVNITTSFERYSLTFSFSDLTDNLTDVNYLSVGINADSELSGFTDITQVQIEDGVAADVTEFDVMLHADELSLCQRYFYKTYNIDEQPGVPNNAGVNNYSNNNLDGETNREIRINTHFPVTMRTTPTVTLFSPNLGTSGVIDTITSGDVGNVIQTNEQKCVIQAIVSGTSQVAVARYHLIADAEL